MPIIYNSSSNGNITKYAVVRTLDWKEIMGNFSILWDSYKGKIIEVLRIGNGSNIIGLIDYPNKINSKELIHILFMCDDEIPISSERSQVWSFVTCGLAQLTKEIIGQMISDGAMFIEDCFNMHKGFGSNIPTLLWGQPDDKIKELIMKFNEAMVLAMNKTLSAAETPHKSYILKYKQILGQIPLSSKALTPPEY